MSMLCVNTPTNVVKLLNFNNVDWRKEMIAYRTTANYKDVMKLGFPEHTSRDIIRRAKQIAIERFNNCNLQKEAVNLRKSPFDNRRLGIAPTEIVEELIGLSLFNDEESERKNV